MRPRRALLAAAALAGGAALAGTALAAPGDLDASFGTGGVTTTQFPPSQRSAATGLALDPFGFVVQAGQTQVSRRGAVSSAFAVVRLGPNGAPDPTFGGGGRVVVEVGGAGNVDFDPAVTVQPDAKVLLAGGVFGQGVRQPGALVRLNRNGSLDPTFGGDGVTRFRPAATDLALQTDGKVLTVGGPFLRRFLADGRPDRAFGRNGAVRLRSDGQHVALQANGRIVVSGTAVNEQPGGPPGALSTLAVERYTPAGRIDRSYNRGRVRVVGLGCGVVGSGGLALDAQGRALLGATALVGVTEFAAIARLRGNGTPDTRFGSRGTALYTFRNPATGGRRAVTTGVLAESDGQIVMSGGNLVELNSNGTLSRTFGARGNVTMPLAAGGRLGPNPVTDTVIEASGRLVAGGSTASGAGTSFALAGVQLLGPAAAPLPNINQTRPGAPRALRAFGRNRAIQASWLGPTRRGASPIRGFVVEYRKVGQPRFNTFCATKGFATIPNLENGATYQVRVAAGNDVGLGPSGPAIRVTVGRAGAPPA